MKSLITLRSFALKAALVSSSLGLVVAPAVLSISADAQQRGPTQRVVQGRIIDGSSAAVKGAVVYLKDGRTLSVKSFISDEQGGYRRSARFYQSERRQPLYAGQGGGG